MKTPRYNEKGELDLASIESLSAFELRKWVENRLLGNDPAFAGESGDLPHYLLIAVYPRLSRFVRQDLEFAVIDFLRDLVDNSDSKWRSSAAVHLLLLTDPILLGTERYHEVVDLLLQIAQDEELPQQLSFGALQALVTLDYHPSPTFWIEVFEHRGESSAGVILEGLARNDLMTAAEWLATIPWTRRINEALLFLLPGLFERHGFGAVRAAFRSVEDSLPTEAITTLRDFAQIKGVSFFSELRGDRADHEVQLFESLVELMPELIARAHEEAMKAHPGKAVGAAQATLTAVSDFIPAAQRLGREGEDSLARTWQEYASSLRRALDVPDLALQAYSQLIAHLPVAETVELTRSVLGNSILALQICRRALATLYDPMDVATILGPDEIAEGTEQDLDDLVPAIADTIAVSMTEREVAFQLFSQDVRAPREEKAWIRHVLAASLPTPLPLGA